MIKIISIVMQGSPQHNDNQLINSVLSILNDRKIMLFLTPFLSLHQLISLD